MKLALVSGEFPPQQGGVGDYTRELAREFARRGLEARVITSEHEGAAKTAAASEEKYILHLVNFTRWGSLGAVDALTRDCDVVQIQYQAAAYGMTPPIHLMPRWLRWRQSRRKVLVTFHDLRIPYLFPKAGPLRARAVRYLSESADAIVVTNQEDEITLARNPRLQISNPKNQPVALIPIGSNIDVAAAGADRTAMRRSLGVAETDTLLCYFGFLNASKGGEALMRVLAQLRRDGCVVRLLMLGGETGSSDPTNASYAARVKALSEELGVSDFIIWAGYRPAAEVAALWHASDIAVLPYEDGVSLRRGTLMAALAHAMPIVSTEPRVTIAQLRDGENIALAQAGDAAALAGKVRELIDSPQRRAQLSAGARLLAQQFTWPRIVDQHLELYRQLIGS